MSSVFQNIEPPTPSPPGECTLVRGWRTHSLGGEVVGGQYFGRPQTLLCTQHMKVLCGLMALGERLLWVDGTSRETLVG
jgi:hypothetical protein